MWETEKDVMNLSARCGPTFTRMCSLPIKHTHILLSLQTYWGTWDLCKTSRNCSDLKVVFLYMKQDIPTFSVHTLLCLFVFRIMILRWSIRTILRRKNIVDHLENKVKTSRLKSKKCFWEKSWKVEITGALSRPTATVVVPSAKCLLWIS